MEEGGGREGERKRWGRNRERKRERGREREACMQQIWNSGAHRTLHA